MYTIEQGIELIYANPELFVAAAMITYGLGFVQYLTSVWMQIKDGTCPFFFFQHCWYFGHDVTFAFICFPMWFFQVKFWMYEVMCIACMLFVIIELYTFYRAVKYERQEIFGRFTGGKEVTLRYAIVRGGLGYVVGLVLFFSLRYVTGDPFCLFLMMTTNAMLALSLHQRYDEYAETKRGAKFLGWATLIGTCFTFAPAGIGLFASFVPPLDCWQFYLVGAICVLCAVRAVWLTYKLPKAADLVQIINEKKAAHASKATA